MTAPEVRPLSALPGGTRAVVTALTGGRGFLDRVVNMGLSVGRELEVLRGAGMGGPVLIATGETRLAIGYGMAQRILVQVQPS